MTHQNWFRNPEHLAYNCYCLDLEPLSIGHLILLRELDSPYPHGSVHTETDLRLAAWICSVPCAKARRRLAGASSWLSRTTWKALTAICDFESEHLAFSTYLADHLSGIATKTKISHPEVGVCTMESPYEWVLLAALCKYMPYSEAMNFPVWRALRLETATAERDGTTEVVSEELLDLFDLVERERVNDLCHGTASESTNPNQG